MGVVAGSDGDWPLVRNCMVAAARRVVMGLDEELTAYQPREVLALLDHPVIASWHSRVQSFTVPAWVRTVVLVPCCRTKPWLGKRGSYGAYNKIRAERDVPLAGSHLRQWPGIYFVTVGEPLGVVPESQWNSFPIYDCPGLFRDVYLRSGLKTVQWQRLLGYKPLLPWDEVCYIACVQRLGQVLAGFAGRYPQLRYVSMLGSARRNAAVHEDILAAAMHQGPRFVKDADCHQRGRHGMIERYNHVKGILEQL